MAVPHLIPQFASRAAPGLKCIFLSRIIRSRRRPLICRSCRDRHRSGVIQKEFIRRVLHPTISFSNPAIRLKKAHWWRSTPRAALSIAGARRGGASAGQGRREYQTNACVFSRASEKIVPKRACAFRLFWAAASPIQYWASRPSLKSPKDPVLY